MIEDELGYREEDVRGVSYRDQLPYRQTIQRIVDRCFLTMELYAMSRHVKALRKALYFQIPGLPFKTRIDEKELELKKKLELKIEKEKIKLGRMFYKNAEQAKFKNVVDRWYWEKLLEYLLDLLAEHDALMRAKGFVEEGMEINMDINKKKEESVIS